MSTPQPTKCSSNFACTLPAKTKSKCKLTTGQLGYHSTNATISKLMLPPGTPFSLTTMVSPVPMAPTTMLACSIMTNDGLHMFYCWTHGLGFNSTHTNATCSNPTKGHCTTTTIKNMQSGNNTIMSNQSCAPPAK